MPHTAHKTGPCPTCGSEELLSVQLVLDTTPVSFAFCTACEWKGWRRDGSTVPLASVLTLATHR